MKKCLSLLLLASVFVSGSTYCCEGGAPAGLSREQIRQQRDKQEGAAAAGYDAPRDGAGEEREARGSVPAAKSGPGFFAKLTSFYKETPYLRGVLSQAIYQETANQIVDKMIDNPTDVCVNLPFGATLTKRDVVEAITFFAKSAVVEPFVAGNDKYNLLVDPFIKTNLKNGAKSAATALVANKVVYPAVWKMLNFVNLKNRVLAFAQKDSYVAKAVSKVVEHTARYCAHEGIRSVADFAAAKVASC